MSVTQNLYDNISICRRIPEKQQRHCHRIFVTVLTPREETIVGFDKRILQSIESLNLISPTLARLLRKRRSREKIAYHIHKLHRGQYGYNSAIVEILRNVATEYAIELQLPESVLQNIPTPSI